MTRNRNINMIRAMCLVLVLIPMLLLSAVFVQMNTIDMDLPSADAETDEAPGQSLELSVRLEAERYVVDGRGLKRRVVDRSAADADQRLTAILAEIHEEHPKDQNIRIVSERATRYQEIITVMDISREAGIGAVALVGNPSSNGGVSEAR